MKKQLQYRSIQVHVVAVCLTKKEFLPEIKCYKVELALILIFVGVDIRLFLKMSPSHLYSRTGYETSHYNTLCITMCCSASYKYMTFKVGIGRKRFFTV